MLREAAFGLDFAPSRLMIRGGAPRDVVLPGGDYGLERNLADRLTLHREPITILWGLMAGALS